MRFWISISGIVRYLNDNGVLTCVEYKQRKNSRYQHPGGGVKKLWGPSRCVPYCRMRLISGRWCEPFGLGGCGRAA